jgi:hypothetical protein
MSEISYHIPSFMLFKFVFLRDFSLFLCCSPEKRWFFSGKNKRCSAIVLLVQREREREREELNSCFSKQGPIVHWNSFPQLVLKLGHSECDPSKWRLCIDASKRSLKGVIYNENVFASVLVAHSVFLKESYENLETLLSRIKYQEHNRKVCGDFETLSTGMLLRQQS